MSVIKLLFTSAILFDINQAIQLPHKLPGGKTSKYNIISWCGVRTDIMLTIYFILSQLMTYGTKAMMGRTSMGMTKVHGIIFC
jgi:hypothetical protein